MYKWDREIIDTLDGKRDCLAQSTVFEGKRRLHGICEEAKRVWQASKRSKRPPQRRCPAISGRASTVSTAAVMDNNFILFGPADVYGTR